MASTDYALFYNSQDGDRVYDADSFEYLLKKFFTTGVFTGNCQVTAYSGMTVKMGSGYCNVDGKVRFFASEQSFTLSAAHATYDRIDAIVIERNDSDRNITAKLVTGTAAATPVAPTPVRSGGVYQLVVAYIRVNHGAYAIVAADITDKRVDTDVCGYVVSACQTPDFSELYTQFTDAFDTWFESMKDQLSEDAAGNLQLEIDNLGSDYVKHSAAQSLTAAQKLQAKANIDAGYELLWQNENPTSPMGKTYPSITQNSYSYYVIAYKKHPTIDSGFQFVKASNDCMVQLHYYVASNTGIAIYHRNIYLGASAPYIQKASGANIDGNGYSEIASSDDLNKFLIPVAIYGTNVL